MDTWPAELTFLKEFEELIRCPICFDHMRAPMMLPSCDHNYCSLCIRRYFSHKEQCPACASPACSNQLRSNRIVEQIIQHFKGLRQPLLALVNSKRQIPGNGSQTENSVSPGFDPVENVENRDLLHSAQILRLPETSSLKEVKKVRTRSAGKQRSSVIADPAPMLHPQPDLKGFSDSEDSDVEIVTEESASPQKRMWSLPCSPSKGMDKPKTKQSKLFGHISVTAGDTSSPESQKRLSNCSSKENDRGKPAQIFNGALTSPKKGSPHVNRSRMIPSMAASSPSKSSTVRHESEEGSGSPLVEKVPCPVCNVPVVSNAVNRHLDICLASQERKESYQLEKKKPLPKLVYNLLSDKDIRKRLKELGLNSQGERQVLIKRHHDFTLYYNADCDSIAAKDMKDLVKEFEDNQKLQTKLNSRSSVGGQSILRFSKDSKVEDVEQAKMNYALQHKTQFQNLIKEARRRMKPKSPKDNETASAENTEGASNGLSILLAPSEAVQSTSVSVDDSQDDACIDNRENNGQGQEQERVEPSASEDAFPDLKQSQSFQTGNGAAEIEGGVATGDGGDFSAGTDTGEDSAESEVLDSEQEGVKKTSLVARKGKKLLRPSKPSWHDTTEVREASGDLLANPLSLVPVAVESTKSEPPQKEVSCPPKLMEDSMPKTSYPVGDSKWKDLHASRIYSHDSHSLETIRELPRPMESAIGLLDNDVELAETFLETEELLKASDIDNPPHFSVAETKGKRKPRDSLATCKRATRKGKKKSAYCPENPPVSETEEPVEFGTETTQIQYLEEITEVNHDDLSDSDIPSASGKGRLEVANEQNAVSLSQPSKENDVGMVAESGNFELTLSDGEEDIPLPARGEENEEIAPVPCDGENKELVDGRENIEAVDVPDNVQSVGEEDAAIPKKSSKKRKSRSSRSSSRSKRTSMNPEAVNPEAELPPSQELEIDRDENDLAEPQEMTADQETEASEAFTLKSLLKKHREKHAVVYKKSVRFAGLRARISDIPFDDGKKASKRGKVAPNQTAEGPNVEETALEASQGSSETPESVVCSGNDASSAEIGQGPGKKRKRREASSQPCEEQLGFDHALPQGEEGGRERDQSSSSTAGNSTCIAHDAGPIGNVSSLPEASETTQPVPCGKSTKTRSRKRKHRE